MLKAGMWTECLNDRLTVLYALLLLVLAGVLTPFQHQFALVLLPAQIGLHDTIIGGSFQIKNTKLSADLQILQLINVELASIP